MLLQWPTIHHEHADCMLQVGMTGTHPDQDLVSALVPLATAKSLQTV